jgi:hypothetical protein
MRSHSPQTHDRPRHRPHRTLAAGLLAASLVAVIVMPSTAGAATATKCSGSFTVLHNDRIGSVPFPHGPYAMTATSLSCAQAANNFRAFLSDWDGKLPNGWRVALSGTVRKFTRASSTQAFTAAPQTKPPPTPSGLGCPGTFQVLHNDRVGAMVLPRGNYKITRLTTRSLTCGSATYWFRTFLDNYSSKPLPKPWTSNAAAKTFYRGFKTDGFKVTLLSGGLGSVLGGSPVAGNDVCLRHFVVGARTSVNGFVVAAGRYQVIATGKATCEQAFAYASQTINNGSVPSGWTISKRSGTFHRKGSTFGFRLDPGIAVQAAFTG